MAPSTALKLTARNPLPGHPLTNADPDPDQIELDTEARLSPDRPLPDQAEDAHPPRA
ncbi:hypothetical protein [Pseudofrankia sp. BMG5.37]|uniref:hypothetical protein n=1 Tax=Pseudofrankia sp. BMG5.37 TaxID=3050035 RepID=UPI002895EC22|nr:hypothetical protein [Pseudofrankia sp. BMG5.37]MDT3444598.1 hypothetical protein [Pseudofrankia sp. BMG5.37]